MALDLVVVLGDGLLLCAVGKAELCSHQTGCVGIGRLALKVWSEYCSRQPLSKDTGTLKQAGPVPPPFSSFLSEP